MLLLLVFACLAPAAAQLQPDEVLRVVQKSAEDWNRGDLNAFMQCYEQSEETTFVGTEVSRGTSAVLARYRRAYPDTTAMGKTTFTELKVRPLSAELAIVTGRFTLVRKQELGGNKTGLFTLVMRKTRLGWRVIHDHTSSDPGPVPASRQP
jgi:uncharacterized protein (TIGR02246 family)